MRAQPEIDADESSRRVSRTVTRRWIAVAAAVHAAIFSRGIVNAFYRPETMQPSLWLWYAARVPETFRVPWRPVVPHFGWTASARLLTFIPPFSDPRTAGALVSIIAAGAFGASLWFVLSRTDSGDRLLRPAVALVASLFVALLETPAALQGWMAIRSPDTSFVPLYFPFVPTTLASMGLNIVMMWMTGRLLGGQLAPERRRWLPAVVLAAALFKPNLVPTLAIAATVAAVMIDSRRASSPGEHGRWSSTALTARFVTLPAVAITVFQYVIITRFVSPYEAGGVGIDPFYELLALGGDGWQFWLVVVFPVAAAVLLGRRLFADVCVSLSAGCFVIGLAAAVLFARTGTTPYKGAIGGDILQLAGTAAAVMIIFAIRRLLVLFTERQISRVVAIVLALLLVPYFLAGADTWRCHAGVAHCYPRSSGAEWPQPPLIDP